MQDLPTNVTAPRYRYRIELDDVSYVLVFRYNTRNNGWHLDVLDADENPLHVGIKMVRNFPLLARDVEESFPPGDLFGVSFGSGQVGRDGLLTRDTALRYFDTADLATLDALINAPSPDEVVTFAPVP